MAYLDLTGLGYFKDKLIDPTLSVAGKAAEDKAVGDAVADFLPTDTSSGAIASFPDGAENTPVKALTVDIEPVQDLNGQSSPYPPGGGKNKFDPSVYSAYVQSDGKYRGSAGQINVIYINIPSSLLNTPCTFSFYADMTNAGTLSTVLAQAVVGGTNKNGNRVDNGYVGRSTVTFTPTSTDDYVHITFGSNGSNEFTFYDIQLEASSSVTDYAPYSNICPISGFAQANVTRTGVNLFGADTVTDTDFMTQYSQAYEAGITHNCSYTASGGTISVTRQDQNPAVFVCIGRCYANVPMSVSFTNSGLVYDIDCRVDDASNPGSDRFYRHFCSSETSVAHTFTPTQDGYVYIEFFNTTGILSGTATNIQFELGSPTTYVPYSGQTITIDLGGTRYGGTLDVVNKVMTVDRVCVDMGSLSWSAGFGGFYSQSIQSNAKIPVSLGTPTAICSMFPWSTSANECFYIHNATNYTGWLIVRTTSYSDATSFKTAMDGVQLVYELATPVTVPLSAQEMTTLLGQNNIFSDAGDVDVTYRADVKLFIQKYIASMVSAQGGE